MASLNDEATSTLQHKIRQPSSRLACGEQNDLGSSTSMTGEMPLAADQSSEQCDSVDSDDDQEVNVSTTTIAKCDRKS